MRRKDISTHEKGTLVNFLLRNSKNGRILNGKIDVAAELINVSRTTVTRVWAAAKSRESRGELMVVPSAKITKQRSKRRAIPVHLLESLPLQNRGTIRDVAIGLKMKKTTVWRRIQSGHIRSHTSAIKPDLTVANKLLRLRFSLEAIEYDRFLKVLKFKSMFNTVHIDEKWFEMTKEIRRFYMGPDEADPHKTCPSKNHIPKVMFMCAVSRPILGPLGEVIFDGKIGIWPFTYKAKALRGSKNRPKGTMITKPIESITKDVIKDCLINQIIPAIKSKWPSCLSKNINIQQDNARPHIKDSDVDFRKAASSDGFNIKLVQQPPNSPDTNINDLGWFRALQSLQIKYNTKTIDELVAAVLKSYEEICPKSLNNVFLSLQCCMVEIMKVKGKNSYKTPHMKKGALERQGSLPIDLQVCDALVLECITYLTEAGHADDIEVLKAQLGMQSN